MWSIKLVLYLHSQTNKANEFYKELGKSSLEYWEENKQQNDLSKRRVLAYAKTEKKLEIYIVEKLKIIYNGEFDPGSGWTLAAGLIHASRGVTGELASADDRRTGA